MDMKEDTLYIHTSRQMYLYPEDGLRHQSNISYEVDTKTMKVTRVEDAYVSHSFSQYVDFDGRDLFLLDHGDANPRALRLTKVKDYSTEDEKIEEYDIFALKGEHGENFTGCTVGGMAVGEKNVLVCGTAHPHYSKIKGVKGSDIDYEYNVYLLVTDKATGETKVNWITQNNPKKTKVSINGARMVKLDDNRYGIIYMTTEKGSSTVHYVVVNGEGKKVYSKKYKGYRFSTETQPIVYKGRVVWRSGNSRMYAIPALTK